MVTAFRIITVYFFSCFITIAIGQGDISSSPYQPSQSSNPNTRKNLVSENLYSKYGFIRFSINPGYKRIHVDREETIGYADKILLPVGNHWVDIVAPKGYIDTSFKIYVAGGGESKVISVNLSNLLGQKAPVINTQAVQKSSGSAVTFLRASALTIGVLSGYLAYYEEQRAGIARDDYDQAIVNTKPLGEHVEGHVQQRNYLATTAAIALSTGIILWAF